MNAARKQMIDDAMRKAVENGAYDKGTILVCVDALGEGFDDDEFIECAGCGNRVRFRPYMPKHLKKICIDCVGVEMKRGA
jgi:hypothetical protein